ncbi:MAG: nitroreductase/quinone reductase family protein [Anaerolineae bacterium]|nr:nitroreductase/quinone reductase family protein [Anaerolineae bacterium]MDW8298524.1 nitroreductase/quinone reductase family protein [Anaerolineae bacterium]
MTNATYSSASGADDLSTWLWRLGLGVLIGQFNLLLTTIGKQSGLPRRASVPYFFVNGKIYALATPDEQWYQNALANPLATLQSAYGTQSVSVRRVTDVREMADAFAHLRHYRPTTAAIYLAQAGVRHFPDDLAAAAPRIHLVTFEPTTAQTPPPLEADLSWLTVIGVLFIGWLLRRRPRRKPRKTLPKA